MASSSPSGTPFNTDVVIVGAGPTGLMTANCLARLGVPAIVVDGKAGPTRESRALVLQARSLELYDQLGLARRALAEAELARAIVPGFEKKRFRAVDLGRLATGVTPFPRVYVLEQSKNEELLVEGLRAAGGDVRWGCRFVSLEALEGGGVRVVCDAGDGRTVTILARYVVGADGSSSAVRAAAGIPFTGVTNAHTFYVADATGVRGLVDRAINLRFGERDFLLAFPMAGRGHDRLLGVVRTSAAGTGGEVTEADTRHILARVFGVEYGASAWFSTYRVHHRVADRFRLGPVFLAGDAAHVHSPVGAQGMNTGLQDAHNLACKIADVVHGRAPEEYLDRYGPERRPVARRLVGTTDTVFGLVTSEKRMPRFARRRVVPLLAPVAATFLPRLSGSSRLFEYLSQTRIHYWMSDRGKAEAHGRRGKVVGRRLRWNGDNFDSLRSMRWQVHVYGEADATRIRQLENKLALPVVHYPVVRHRRLVSGTCYLLRPDGFVAASAPLGEAAEVFLRSMPARASGR